jgi:hypothetical protein
MGTYHQFDMIVESENGDANVQIKTLVPFVKERYWSISGEKTVENFLNADEAYIISIPVRLNDTTDAHLWKFQGRMLRVNLDELRKQRGTSMLIIPMDEEVEEYYDLTEEETLSLLKYPVSYFTIKPSEWNQKSKMKYSTQILAK